MDKQLPPSPRPRSFATSKFTLLALLIVHAGTSHAECDRALGQIPPSIGELEQTKPLAITGDPISTFSARLITLSLNRHRDTGETFAGTRVTHASIEQILELGNLRLIKRFGAAVLARNADHDMIIEEAGPVARELLAGVDQTLAAPHETYRFTLTDPKGNVAVSSVRASEEPLEIDGSKAGGEMGQFLMRHLPNIETGWFYPLNRLGPPACEFLHCHPAFEVLVEAHLDSGHGLRGLGYVSYFPLNAPDLETAEVFSRQLPHYLFVVSAVTLNGHKYTAIFKNGKNVTRKLARAYLTKERRITLTETD